MSPLRRQAAFVHRRRRPHRAEASPARAEQLHGKKNEVTSRHRDREKENDQGEGSLTIDDHSTTWGRRREFADVLAGSVAVLKLLPGLLLGVASSFSQAWDLAAIFNSCRRSCCRGRDGFLRKILQSSLERGASKTSAQSGYMEGKRRQNSTPELKERRR